MFDLWPTWSVLDFGEIFAFLDERPETWYEMESDLPPGCRGLLLVSLLLYSPPPDSPVHETVEMGAPFFLYPSVFARQTVFLSSNPRRFGWTATFHPGEEAFFSLNAGLTPPPSFNPDTLAHVTDF